MKRIIKQLKTVALSLLLLFILVLPDAQNAFGQCTVRSIIDTATLSYNDNLTRGYIRIDTTIATYTSGATFSWAFDDCHCLQTGRNVLHDFTNPNNGGYLHFTITVADSGGTCSGTYNDSVPDPDVFNCAFMGHRIISDCWTSGFCGPLFESGIADSPLCRSTNKFKQIVSTLWGDGNTTTDTIHAFYPYEPIAGHAYTTSGFYRILMNYALYNPNTTTTCPLRGNQDQFYYIYSHFPSVQFSGTTTVTVGGTIRIIAHDTTRPFNNMYMMQPHPSPPSFLAWGDSSQLWFAWFHLDTQIVRSTIMPEWIQGRAYDTILTLRNIVAADSVAYFCRGSSFCGEYTIDTIHFHILPRNTGLTEVLHPDLSVSLYPNPADRSVTIVPLSFVNDVAQCTFTNALGAVVYSAKVNTNERTKVDFDLPQGIYLLTIEAAGRKVTERLVVARE